MRKTVKKDKHFAFNEQELYFILKASTVHFKNQEKRRPWINFTNILQAAFTHTDPKSAIKLLNLTVFFTLLRSAFVKAAHRMLVKLTPDLNAVAFPGAVPEHVEWDAWADAGEEAVEHATLAQVIGVAIDET